MKLPQPIPDRLKGKVALITGAAGTFVSTIQNTLTKQNVGAFGIFTKSGSTIAVFGALKIGIEELEWGHD